MTDLRKGGSGDFDVLSGDTGLNISTAGDESGMSLTLKQFYPITVVISATVKKPRFEIREKIIRIYCPLAIDHAEWLQVYGTLLKKVKMSTGTSGMLYVTVSQLIDVISGLVVKPFEVKIDVEESGQFKYSLISTAKMGKKSTTVIKSLKRLKELLKQLDSEENEA